MFSSTPTRSADGCRDGLQIPLTLLFKEKRRASCWHHRARITLYLRSTGTDWSSHAVFGDWIQHFFVERVPPSDHLLGKALLMCDGSRTHWEPQLPQMCKSKGVEILLLPPKCTNIMH